MITSHPGVEHGSHLPMDPRIHERRVEVQRANDRRRLNLLVGVATVVAVVALTLGLLHTPLASVRDTQIGAIRHESDSVILAAAGISKGEPLIDVNAGLAAARIEALPWVQSASVRRSWPSEIIVRVVARHAVAQIPTGPSLTGPMDLIDGTGRVLQARRSPVVDLPVLLGAGSPAAMGQWLAGTAGRSAVSTRAAVAAGLHAPPSAVAAALALARSFVVAGLGQNGGVGPDRAWISRIEVSAGDGLSAVAEPASTTLNLGPDSNLPAKLDAVIAVLSDVSTPPGSVVDLSDPNRPTVSAPPATSAPA